MTTKTTALTDCRFCGSEIGARGLICAECGKQQRPFHKVFYALPPHEQENWQHMESWSYANDGENSSHLWDDGEWGAGPKFLGLTLEQWVTVEGNAPHVIAAFELEDAVARWRRNDHIYDRGDAYDALTLKRREERASLAAPLRLIFGNYSSPSDGDLVDEYGSAIDLGPTDLEHAVWDLLDNFVCPSPSRGVPLNTDAAVALITLIERDPKDLVAYIRKFVASKAAAFQPKAKKKRMVERKLVETGEIPF